FGVQHGEARAAVEAGRVAVGVAPAASEVGERGAGVAEPDQATVGDAPVLDPGLVVAGVGVPAEPQRALAERRGQSRRPQVRRLADVAVGVDDDVGARHAEDSARGAPPPSTGATYRRSAITP